MKEEATKLKESFGWKPFDELVGKGAWRKTVQESEKILKPVLKRNKKWREESQRGMVNFG